MFLQEHLMNNMYIITHFTFDFSETRFFQIDTYIGKKGPRTQVVMVLIDRDRAVW